MKSFALHAGIVILLFALQFVLPPYHHSNAARIMVYAVLAVGYNVLFGYTGLMSLGHAMFFAAGAYGTGLGIFWLGLSPLAGLGLGIASGIAMSAVAGGLLIRSTGVSFLIVTLMLAQAVFLSILYFNTITFGDQGLVLTQLAPLGPVALNEPWVKYNLALLALCVALAASLWVSHSAFGRVLVAIRENEPRTRMLGYETSHYRFAALMISGTLSSLSGALYCLLFSYVGASFASLQYSTFPLLWTLLGGAGTVIGPLLGTGLMFYLVDISSSYTSSYLLVVGAALVALTLWFPKGIAGTLRSRYFPWLP